jgi:hypothetical protein
VLAAAASVALVAVGAAPARSNDFDLPIGGVAQADEDYAEPPPAEDEPPRFYDEDIPDTSQSVIYVIDRSSSMSLPTAPFVGGDGQVVSDGTRLDYVKAELRRSISSLPEDFSFNMIIYDECVESWKPGRVRADAPHKAEALAWVDRIEPWGWTNTGGATSRALDDHGNQVVLLLSDGAPNFLDCSQTYIADFETHRRIIRTANTQHAVIHTFGLGLDGETREFMAAVARDSGGTFREID